MSTDSSKTRVFPLCCLQYRLLQGILLLALVVPSALFSISIPSIYQCSALRITQHRGDRSYSKGYQVNALYISFTASDVRVSGIHSQIIICRKLGIRRIFKDTVFLENPPEIATGHSEPKLYFSGDTLMGNVNLFEQDTSDITIKALVRKIRRIPEPELEHSCN